MPTPFNPTELLTLAIKIEENGHAYYSEMALFAKTPELKALLSQLAQAELKHVDDFRHIQKLLLENPVEMPEEYLTTEIEGYLHSMADGKIFPNLKGIEDIATEITSEFDAIRHAISFEKDSIIFFTEIFDMLPTDFPDRQAITALIHQEKIHIAQLYIILGKVYQK